MLADIIRRRDLVLAGLGSEEEGWLPIDRIREQYMADLGTRCSHGHIRRTRDCLNRILAAIAAGQVAELKPLDVMGYRQVRQAEGVSNKTVNLEVGSLKAMLTWAAQAQIAPPNPIAHIKNLPTGKAYQRRPRRALGEAEAQKLIDAAFKCDIAAGARKAAKRTIAGGSKGSRYMSKARKFRVPQAPLWLALLETGARWGELTQSVWADLDFIGKTLALRPETTKSKRERQIPLGTELLAELLTLRKVHEGTGVIPPPATDLIFLTPNGTSWEGNRPNALRHLRQLLRDAGIAKTDSQGRSVDIHALRHTFATRLARAGVGLAQAQKLLGHADVRMTAEVYTHLENEDLHEAITSLPRLRISGAKVADDAKTEGHGKRKTPSTALLDGSGGRIRTCDLRVMSPTSCLTAPPRDECGGILGRVGAESRERGVSLKARGWDGQRRG